MRKLALTLAALALAVPAFAAEDTIRKGFNVSEGGTLRLTAGIGTVTIVSGGTGVAVEIVRSSKGRSAEQRMRDHKISVTQSGNDVVIDGPMEREWMDWGFWNDYEVEWNIRVPARYNVAVQTSGGSVKLANIGGTADVKTSGGSIRTGRISGEANLKSSGGSISVDGGGANVKADTSGGSISIGDTTGSVDAHTSGGGISLGRIGGDIVARTSGGGIEIDDAGGSVEAKTSGGSIEARLSGQPREDSQFITSGGGVTLSIANGIGAELDARSSGGAVRADVPVTVQGTMDDNEIRGRIGNGGPRITLRSSGGGIRVRSL
ncbi:MAG TPA: hypothetical protein VEK11_05770 [Thermoanaerobaculia bacterium]|nr:hypothetical protein [Thermoanaerobaculia bacterium]